MNLNGDFFLNRKMIIAIDSMDRNSIFDPKLGLRIIAVLVAIKQKINNIEIGLVLDFGTSALRHGYCIGGKRVAYYLESDERLQQRG